PLVVDGGLVEFDGERGAVDLLGEAGAEGLVDLDGEADDASGDIGEGRVERFERDSGTAVVVHSVDARRTVGDVAGRNGEAGVWSVGARRADPPGVVRIPASG